MSIGIAAIEYVLPPQSFSLRELDDAGLLSSTAALMQNFGYGRCYVSAQPAEELALSAAAKLLEAASVEPETIDLLLYAGAIACSHQITNGQPLTHFNYPAARLQYELGLMHAGAIGVSQSGCMALTNAVKMAADFLCANSQMERVLCVSADVLPRGSSREVMYNIVSDGACAVLVERGCPRNRILAHRAVTKGYYWDSSARKNEIMAAYFPTAKNVVQDVLSMADCRVDELSLLLPHNVSRRSWQILLGLIGVTEEQLFAENIARNGHVIAADNWINLKDAMDRQLLQPADKFMMFNFGFGANWAATVMEH